MTEPQYYNCQENVAVFKNALQGFFRFDATAIFCKDGKGRKNDTVIKIFFYLLFRCLKEDQKIVEINPGGFVNSITISHRKWNCRIITSFMGLCLFE